MLKLQPQSEVWNTVETSVFGVKPQDQAFVWFFQKPAPQPWLPTTGAGVGVLVGVLVSVLVGVFVGALVRV